MRTQLNILALAAALATASAAAQTPVLAVEHAATIDRQPRHGEEDGNHADDEDRRGAALGGTSTAQPQLR